MYELQLVLEEPEWQPRLSFDSFQEIHKAEVEAATALEKSNAATSAHADLAAQLAALLARLKELAMLKKQVEQAIAAHQAELDKLAKSEEEATKALEEVIP